MGEDGEIQAGNRGGGLDLALVVAKICSGCIAEEGQSCGAHFLILRSMIGCTASGVMIAGDMVDNNMPRI